MRLSTLCIVTLAMILVSPLHALAAVALPSIFADHMVLQRDMPVPIWGEASRGERVTVTFAGQTVTTTTDDQSRWRVVLRAMPASATGQTLTIAGENTITLNDVLVGDVWVCSGQSNMAFPLKSVHNASVALPQADQPAIRLFQANFAVSPTPVARLVGQWSVSTPESAAEFSAVGWFFARDIQRTQNVPIGLIGVHQGSSVLHAWTRLGALESVPQLQHYVKEYHDYVAALPAQIKTYEEETLPQWAVLNDAWRKAYLEARARNEETTVPRPGKRPTDPRRDHHHPTVLFNAKIAPLVSFPIKGVLWYQGETGSRPDYELLFQTMIRDWRSLWGQGDFPFLYVQVSGWETGRGHLWIPVRNAQLKTLKLPYTAMVVTADISERDSHHPLNKFDVGRRLAQAARAVAYGEDVVYMGPIYRDMQVKDGRVVVSFLHTGSGLVIGSAPPIRLDQTPAPPLDHLTGFEVAGEDERFVPARARIQEQTVVVWSDEVPQPRHVRLGWSGYPEINLYNREGLPASPFTSQDPPGLE